MLREGYGSVGKNVVIENPVINSPFVEPQRHFRFDDETAILTLDELKGQGEHEYDEDTLN